MPQDFRPVVEVETMRFCRKLACDHTEEEWRRREGLKRIDEQQRRSDLALNAFKSSEQIREAVSRTACVQSARDRTQFRSAVVAEAEARLRGERDREKLFVGGALVNHSQGHGDHIGDGKPMLFSVDHLKMLNFVKTSQLIEQTSKLKRDFSNDHRVRIAGITRECRRHLPAPGVPHRARSALSRRTLVQAMEALAVTAQAEVRKRGRGGRRLSAPTADGLTGYSAAFYTRATHPG